jgi:predicted RND superfamily exporter protein
MLSTSVLIIIVTVSDAVEVIERYEAILGDTQEKKKSTVRMVNETIQEGI